MENFEDSFNYQGEFMRYFPTYQAMNDAQLRGYFSWRTKVRKGVIEKTSLSFVFVYIYELLNQIGVSTAEEGFYALKDFWQTYKTIDTHINHYLRIWLKDYVVYNNLDKNLLEDFSETNFDQSVLILLNCKTHNPDEVFSALNALSAYDFENSRFYKKHPDDVNTIVYNVFCLLADYYDKKRKNSICEKFFGRMYASPYQMFRSAVFYKQTKQTYFVYQINDIYQYKCENGNWTCERFFGYSGKNKQIGALLKTIDFLMRQKYNFKSTLKIGKTTKISQAIIEKEIEKLQEERRKKALPKIEIDLSKLQDIRKSALETQSRLIIEEPEQPAAVETYPAEPARQNELNISEQEYHFLQCLLYGKTYAEFVKSKGLLLSVLVDSINDNLFDRFGDTVIMYNGDKPELTEDYIDELKGIIKE